MSEADPKVQAEASRAAETPRSRGAGEEAPAGG